MSVIIYTDGGARGNPGPSGAGAVVYDGTKQVAHVSKYLGIKTNNFAEYEALILALGATHKVLGSPVTREVQVRMDSELVVKQMNGQYRVKDVQLKKQHEKVRQLIAEAFPHITFSHVRREHNKEADAFANAAMDRGE